MSENKKLENLEDLKGVQIPKEPAAEQKPAENPAPEQKKTLKEKFADAKKASVAKKIEKEQAKITKLQQKLNPVEKTKKVKIDKKKVLVGAGVGAAILGGIGAACLRHAGQIRDEASCEDETYEEDCYEEPEEETETPETEETEA